MPDPTRFDLSRLEGCTGTVSESGVAVPHSLRPALHRRDDAKKHRPREEQAPADEESKDSTRNGESENDEWSRTTGHATDEPEGPDAGPRPRAFEDDAPASPARPSAAATAPTFRSIEDAVRPTTPSSADDEREGAEVPLGFILALTLAAWLPVLLIWSLRIG